MKNKIAFVAVGQAGGNIGHLFEEKGYSVLYINTSQEDLNTLETAKYKYHIPNGEGCNKDRQMCIRDRHRSVKQCVICSVQSFFLNRNYVLEFYAFQKL